MKCLTSLRTRSGGILFLVGVLSGQVHAGDPIVFSNQKGKGEPGKELKAESNLLKSFVDRNASPSLLEDVHPAMPPGNRFSLDPRLLKRLRNVADEQRNFLLVKEGDLQKKDDEEEASFGGKNFSLDGKAGGKSRDYTFFGLDEPKQPGKLNPGEDGKLPLGLLRQMRELNESESKRDRNNSLTARTDGGLDLGKMIEVGKGDNGLAAAPKSIFTVKELINPGTPLALPKAADSHAENFRNFLDSPRFASPLSGTSDPLKSPATATLPLGPVSSAMEGALRNPNNGALGRPFPPPALGARGNPTYRPSEPARTWTPPPRDPSPEFLNTGNLALNDDGFQNFLQNSMIPSAFQSI